MKTRVTFKQKFGDFSPGQDGFIDGYLTGIKGIPSAAVVVGDKMAAVPLTVLKVLPDTVVVPYFPPDLTLPLSHNESGGHIPPITFTTSEEGDVDPRGRS